MLASFIYSLNAILPIFILVALGFVLKKTKLLSEAFFSASEKLVFKLALPVMLFLEVSGAELSDDFIAPLVIYCSLGIIVLFFTLCLIVPIFVKDNAKRGALIQGIYRSNFAILGIPLAENMFGDVGRTNIAFVIPFAIILFNILAVVLLTVFAPDEEKKNISAAAVVKDIIFNILKNPLIIAVVLGIPFMLFKWLLPAAADKTLNYIGALSTPLALMSLGANCDAGEFKNRLGQSIIGALCKTVAVPAVTVFVAAIIGFRNDQLGTVFILFGAPTAVTSYIMAKQMKSDYILAGQILLFSTAMCLGTIFAGAFILKYTGLI